MLLTHKSLTRLTVLLLILFSHAVFAHKDGGIKVKNAWVREAPPVSPVLAGYMTIENHTGKTMELTEVKSSKFQKIEIHQTVHKDGMASMEAQSKLAIPSEDKLELKPGGTHLMLINPVEKLKAGDKVSFTLVFANGSKTIIGATVRKAKTMSSGHHDHSTEKHGHDNLEHGEHGKNDHHKDDKHHEKEQHHQH